MNRLAEEANAADAQSHRGRFGVPMVGELLIGIAQLIVATDRFAR